MCTRDQERRVAERRQQTARVRHGDDEEWDEVCAVLAPPVGPEERADHQHAGASRPDEAFSPSDAPSSTSPIVGRRLRLQVAAQGDPARRHVERPERRHERGDKDLRRVRHFAEVAQRQRRGRSEEGRRTRRPRRPESCAVPRPWGPRWGGRPSRGRGPGRAPSSTLAGHGRASEATGSAVLPIMRSSTNGSSGRRAEAPMRGVSTTAARPTPMKALRCRSTATSTAVPASSRTRAPRRADDIARHGA